MTLTLDSSAAYELLISSTPRGEWLRTYVGGHDFVAPTLLRFELVNLIRRSLARNILSPKAADATLRRALALPMTEFELGQLLERAWAHRGSYTFFDASYIAVAELTSTALLTTDSRLAEGPAVACQIVLPPLA